ncbi:MAG: glycosyltransferase family 39 protein [Isosphaeraceae bacterium]|nr:glycosyltransferase family 39 protein [Isosphaeraceae bacterium]
MTAFTSRIRPRLWRPDPQAEPAGPSNPPPAAEARWALAFILVVMSAQIVFLTVGCDWDLCGDEAEYWAWSRRLDWSYYAKGPLIAFLIRLATTLGGDLSEGLTGSLMPAVRLPAVLLGALTAWGVFRLAAETCRSARAGLVAVLILPAIPLFRIGGLIMTIDTPLVCCWTWAAVWSYRGIMRGGTRAWLLAGLLVALGVMAKYTMLAFPASVGLFLLLGRARRRQLLRPGFWFLALGCGVGMAPIVYWNTQHGWLAAEQMSNRLGLDSSWNWGRLQPLLAFLGGEVLALGIWGYFGLRALGPAATGALRPDDEGDRAGRLYLFCLWIVVWSACVAACLLGETEMNWSAPAHVSLLALAGGWLAPRVLRARPGQERPQGAWQYGLLWGLSLAGLTALQHTEWFYPALSRITPAPTAGRPAPLRELDPTCRMRGYRELEPAVDARLVGLRAEGLDPFVLTPTYTLAATLSFYLKGQPEVYCVAWSPGLAARALNQHDLWRPNPRHDLNAFLDRPVVIVEDATRGISYAQGAVAHGVVRGAGTSERVLVRRGGTVVAAWDITVYPHYTGLRDVEENRVLLQTYATPAYYAAQGGTPQAFVRGLYRDLLGRAPTDQELADWVTTLSGQPRALLVSALARRDEYRRRRETERSSAKSTPEGPPR